MKVLAVISPREDSTPYRAHPEFEMRAKNINHPGLLSPDIKIYELTAGGVRELKDEWCATGKANVQGALIQCFRERPLEIKPVTVDKEMEEEMEDIYALYRAVSTSINIYTYGDFKFPEKMKNFDDSIGPIDNILQKHGTDASSFTDSMRSRRAEERHYKRPGLLPAH